MGKILPAGLPENIAKLLAREGTNISWAHFTFNPWMGCEKVSPACDNCYAEDVCGLRLGVEWGPEAERKRTSPNNWKKPLRWNRIAAAAGVQLRVFCASLADVFDKRAPAGARADLADLIRRTPNLTWMMLTKRIPNVEAMLVEMFPEGVPPNVWLGITVALDYEARRDIPRALAIKDKLGLQPIFLSMEPLLGPVKILDHLMQGRSPGHCGNCGKGHGFTRCPNYGGISKTYSTHRDGPITCSDFRREDFAISLVIVGGESGVRARPLHPAWVAVLHHQCAEAFVPFHFKQWGEWMPVTKFVMAGDTSPTAGRIESATMFGRKYEGDHIHHFPDNQPVVRVGQKKAGRMLAGREWLEAMA